jgi:hypothetical protein
MALDKRKIRRNLFESTQPGPAAPAEAPAAQAARPRGGGKEEPKFKQYDVKLSILLTGEQLEHVDRLVKEIMRSRTTKKERITKNSVFRCLVDLLTVLPFNTDEIPDEDELRRRLLAAAGR